MKEYEIDSVVLGCTHYPLLRGVIGRETGDGVRLVNPAYETAKSLKEMLKEKKNQLKFHLNPSYNLIELGS